MSIHPNAILLLVLTPDDLARKTYLAILGDAGIVDEGEDSDQIKIGSEEYQHQVMEENYDDGMQIKAPEGSIVFFDLVTYGYGEVISWEDLEKQKNELDFWAQAICTKHHCSYAIKVTANYW